MPERIENLAEYQKPNFETELIPPSEASWQLLKNDLMRLEEECFGEHGFTEEQWEEVFANPSVTFIILKDKVQNLIEGYSYAYTDEEDPETAYVEGTAVAKKYQKQKLVGKLLTALDAELKRKGYKYVARHSAVSNGYADSLARHYGDRVVKSEEYLSEEYGPQRYLKIRLDKEDEN